ncbi:2-oxo acid dehydrogenase subunit E2 [Mesobacillus maritimus]|uniref:dihydrolipoamide acetyltransferase family protein n=1 Tax=Mesobacillus maritimus TaxID=1643336 RepID=UPI00203F5A7A|nr:dihydrolipoamide acetyltransferase family protein [Mesobacillus maritimus]MCM3672090.1 2-oxo acid dehydrogenase subunit E2 [Mesobacillus maritimus]
MSEVIVMPKLGMTMTEGTIVEWHKEVGEPVSEGEPVLTISSEKLTQEVEAPVSGILLVKNAEVDEQLEVGAAIAVIGEEGGAVQEVAAAASVAVVDKVEADTAVAAPAPVREAATKVQGDRIFITPLARKMAKEHQLDIALIEGTGGNGRITKRDIERALQEGTAAKAAVETKAEAAPAQASVSPVNDETIGAGLNPMRKAIARNMRRSLGQTAQLTIHRKVNANALIDFQNSLKKQVAAADLDVKLTITVLVARAAVLALQEMKEVNSHYVNGTLTEFDEVHLGIATALDDGLVVPVVKNAHQKTIGTLAKEIKDVSVKARNGEASGDLLTGSTFTITNLGASGIEYFTPILNTPETGILGVGSFQDELALDEKGQVKMIKKIPFSLTFDHQIVDGATAAEFLNKLSKYIETPYLLVL